MRGLLAWVAALVAAQPAWSQAPVAEPAPVTASPASDIAVTVYRDPGRRAGQSIDRNWPQGFALITERRTVTLPAGRSTVRFEGVAGGIVPVSAIVTGLPGGTIEKNRDARILSPAALVDGSLGRQVTLRRTDRATGAVREEEATVVSGPANGVVLKTASGIEVLGCSGLPEKPVYAGVPAGLSAQPVLSVVTDAPRATTATVTLSYLASAFDWTASYVATVAPDGRTLDLFAWLTLANANTESFANAGVAAVAGRLERRFVRTWREAAERLSLRCYPLGTTTSDLPDGSETEDIVVTGSRVMQRMVMPAAMAAPPPPPPPPPAPPPPPEDLGDLKLYRVPERVLVAANQQKQVALLAKAKVPFDRVLTTGVGPYDQPARPVSIELRMRNEVSGGLGIPLPAGTTSVLVSRGSQRLPVAMGTVADAAVGQRFKLSAGTSPQVMVTSARTTGGGGTVTLTNANATAVTVEVRISGSFGATFDDFSQAVKQVDGVPTWVASVPANGTATLRYGVREPRARP